MKRRVFVIFLSILSILLVDGCRTTYEEPPIALDDFEIVEGFRIDVVAAEPLIHDPIALSFDADGRPWVVEMRGYMPNVDGTGEDVPTGRIVILEDWDEDGRMDHRTVFLDSLVLPRAISHVRDGILYAEPPNLWYVENQDDRPGRRVLVDSIYAVGGNVEHQPNGLLRGLDNWIYSAKSSARYRFMGGRWLKDSTEFRGQWGIAHDDYGRLFYNDNSNQLQGDLAPPNSLLRNPHHEAAYGIGVQIAEDQRVYPLHATAVNRGYQPHVLDSTGRLRHVTAACGPVIYRGDNFPPEYYGNAFVAEPAGNLIKRNILYEEGARVAARQAYDGREFLASYDEAFRPVNLYNGPDGTLYVVDFYRGIIQHKTYLTDYLREQIQARGLDSLVGNGRIYRIIHETKAPSPVPRLSEQSGRALVPYLAHANGWVRDTAQHLIVDRRLVDLAPQLAGMAADTTRPLAQIHALWTLEGLGALSPSVLDAASRTSHPGVLATVARLAEPLAASEQVAAVFPILERIAAHPDAGMHLQLALTLGRVAKPAKTEALSMLADMAHLHRTDSLFHHAIVSGLAGREQQFMEVLRDHTKEAPAPLEAMLAEAAAKRLHMPENLAADQHPESIGPERWALGESLYQTHCSTCHHAQGRGLTGLAPPLRQSEYVEGSAERLALIVLHGMTGPVTVNGRRYAPPAVQPVMPGLKDNATITDEELATLLSYIRNAWGNEALPIDASMITRLRQETAGRQALYTEEELQSLETDPSSQQP